MIPKSLSATSLQVWQLCSARWVAEYLNRTRGRSNVAADTGTAVHGGLENFVKALYVDKTHAGLDKKKQKELLVTMYQMSYMQTFNTPDMETPEYKDGLELTLKWFKRTDLDTKEMIGVDTVEVKRTIDVPYNNPDGTVSTIPFNYIMDRVDQITETSWEVVDYKTIRVPLDPEDLENKIQARAYALAIQIEHPEAERISVTFDQLRHNPVTMVFRKQDNINFWHFLVARAQQIVDTREEDVTPTMNGECGYCPAKFTCPLITRNIAAGGIHSLSDDAKVTMLGNVTDQIKALNGVKAELQESAYKYAAANDTLDWETSDGRHKISITAPSERVFSAQRAAEIMGPDLFAQIGKLTLGELDKIIKDESVPAEIREGLKNLITHKTGSLRTSVKSVTKI